MSKRQSVFGLGTGIGVALLGATLSPVDAAGWHLMAVGVGIGALTVVSELLQLRPQPVPVTHAAPSDNSQAH